MLFNYLTRHYGKKVALLLDERDTPMQETWVQFVPHFYNSRQTYGNILENLYTIK